MMALAELYHFAKETVLSHGYGEEILWQDTILFDAVDETYFLQELGWVIISSGLNEKAARSVFTKITPVFYNWKSASDILDNRDDCLINLIKFFKHCGKIDAIFKACEIIHNTGFHEIKNMIEDSPISVIQNFPYMGPKTAYHFAKNIGLNFAKPDRHLERIATLMGYSDVQLFCQNVSNCTGDSVPVVDIVLWRFATIEKDYLQILDKLYTEFATCRTYLNRRHPTMEKCSDVLFP